MRIRSLRQLVYAGLLVLLVLIPFHAGFTARFSSDWLEGWKEAVVLLMCLVAAAWLWADKRLRHRFLANRLNVIILAYVMLNGLYALLASNRLMAEAIGLRTNVIFLLVYLLAWLTGSAYSWKRLQSHWLKWLLVPAAVVAAFGIVQAFIPDLLLRLLHNNPFIAPERPFQFVQDAPILRLNSTLWGPSQLGSYLVLPLCLVFWLRLRQPHWRWSLLLGGLLICLYGSQSRGSWLAAGIGLGVVGFMHWRHRLSRRTLLTTLGAGLVLVITLLIVGIKFNTPLSNVLLHSKSSLAFTNSSNSDHLEAMKKGLEHWHHNPLGSGPGAAGPASQHNTQVLYTESYYLQLLVETSVWGLGLFLIICLSVLRTLAKITKAKPVAVPLLAAGLGLVVLNVLHHAWSDAATSLLWWGSAGMLLGSKP